MSRKPYNPVPWQSPFAEDNVLECSDRSTHAIEEDFVDTWDVCSKHNYRWRCPRNYPAMCKNPYGCAGDHCCRQALEECPAGERVASTLLALELPEWVGMLPAAWINAVEETTTLDPYQQFLNSLRTTTGGPSFAQQVADYAWAGSAVLVAIGLTCSCLACYYMGLINLSYMRKALGTARLLNIYHSDPVTFLASGNLPRNKKREAPLPPLRPRREIEEERKDKEAMAALHDAWDLATLKGMRHLVNQATDPDPLQAKLLKDAMKIARARGLQARAEVSELIDKGE